jgi:hypothetical protein
MMRNNVALFVIAMNKGMALLESLLELRSSKTMKARAS